MTGKTKSGQLRITKSIGALLVVLDEGFDALTNEKITMHIERSNGSNEEIATNIPLNAFISSSIYGEGTLQDGEGTVQTALCEIANNGGIHLEENESIIISLTDLKSASTYSLHGLEMPVKTIEKLFLTEKVLLAGQKNRVYDVEQFDEAVLIGAFDKVRIGYETEQGIRTVEFSAVELRGISGDIDMTASSLLTGRTEYTTFSLVEAKEIELFSLTQVNLVLRDINKIS